jgi:hypothetical protein
MKIALFYNRSPGTIGEYFHRALSELGESVEHFNVSEADRCEGPYDLYWRVDHGDYTEDLPERLRPRAFYIVDAHLAKSWRSIRRQAPGYDTVFCAQRRAAELLPRAHWVPLGCDPALHRGTPNGSASYDVAFVGADGGVPRKFYLEELRQRYPRSFIGRAPHTEMPAIYGRSKIGFHYIECTSPLRDHVSMRVYEILAGGSLLMANALEAQAFESVGLRDGQELVVYRSPSELFRLIDHYLAHEAERRRIAEAGQRAALTSHTYRQRVERMLQIVRRPGAAA